MTTAFSNFSLDVLPTATALRAAITQAYRRPEADAVAWLLNHTTHDAGEQATAQKLAAQLVGNVRTQRTRASGVDALMHEFSLSSEEGVALMCLAEALLRIPDAATADRLIADKISKGDWRRHLGESPSMFVNAATWGLLVTGKLVSTTSETGLTAALGKLITRGGEPLIRKGVDLAMRMLGKQFVTGQTIEEAIQHSLDNERRGYQYSYDMLGEAALTADDAAHYFAAYESAIHAIGRTSNGRGVKNGPGISVKLSALHPRYSRSQRARVMSELLPRLTQLLLLAKQYNIGLNIDAEETDRLELSLDLMEALAFDDTLAGYDGLGFVVQAYQKRCPFVIDFLIDLAHRSGRRFMVRLVKGAYWDAEIKRAQVDGQDGYPVYTRKVYTDVSYLACAQKLLAATDVIYPQFATHNAHTVATIHTWAQASGVDDYEFQCLHGMGETLYDQVVGAKNLNKICRIYAPVGSHVTLLAYLVRRLLENGANSSFVNQIVDENISIDTLIADPIDVARELKGAANKGIALPVQLFGDARLNSMGMDFSDENTLRDLNEHFTQNATQQWQATPLLGEHAHHGTTMTAIKNPAQHNDIVGHVVEATPEDVQHALSISGRAAATWQATPAHERAATLAKAATLFEKNTLEFITLAVREAGKSLPNAIAELREAVDFLRYYAAQVAHDTETRALGAVVCIAPWNFPLAIFTGEITAALAAGNAVLAKPAEQTPLIAHRAVQLLHEAGVPRDVLQFLPGRGDIVGATLVNDSRVKGVIFTGSTEVAHIIHRSLAARAQIEGAEIPLIAETGGQNALIMDSSALPEQVITDVLSSAFDSAGQRCSALRVLCLQTDIFDRTLEMLHGAFNELRVGNPDQLATDVGPVIDAEAQNNLFQHIEHMRSNGHRITQLEPSSECHAGTFVPPTIIEINALSELTQEVFGPVLHVLKYKRAELPQLIDALNATGYGLTLGVHTRIDETVDFIVGQAHVGNIYINRNIVGAVVGVQPFGGEGKSGTGPKAGGPLYVRRLQQDAHLTRKQLDHQAEPAVSLSNTAQSFLTWAQTHGHSTLAQRTEQYANEQLNGHTMVLPSPTGERNTLRFAPRGTVLCAAVNTESLLNQIAAVLTTGNTPLLTEQTHRLLPQGLPSDVRSAITLIKSDAIASARIDLALLDEASAQELRSLLANRSSDAGGLVQIVITAHNNAIPLWRLVAERAVCVNTTAAGGNASLMAMAG